MNAVIENVNGLVPIIKKVSSKLNLDIRNLFVLIVEMKNFMVYYQLKINKIKTMCNCIKEIETKILEAYPVYNNKKVEKVEASGVFNLSKGFRKETTTNFMLVIENQKKEIPIQVSHTFCPFCGIKKE
jgi:hypothetical protein